MLIILVIVLLLILLFYEVIININKQKELTKTAQKLNEIIDFEKIKDEYNENIKQEKENKYGNNNRIN